MLSDITCERQASKLMLLTRVWCALYMQLDSDAVAKCIAAYEACDDPQKEEVVRMW